MSCVGFRINAQSRDTRHYAQLISLWTVLNTVAERLTRQNVQPETITAKSWSEIAQPGNGTRRWMYKMMFFSFKKTHKSYFDCTFIPHYKAQIVKTRGETF